MSDFALNLALNGLSFGNISCVILREIYSRGLNPCIFPIGGNADFSSQKIDKELGTWITQCINKSSSQHKRSVPTIKVWHLDGSLESYSEKQVLLSFYELDSPTEVELNIAKNQKRVIFTNKAASSCFESFGCDNVSTIPLAFDAANFHRIEKPYFADGRIVFNITGKFEKRKGHQKAIKAWAKRFGNNPLYFLQCAIYNPFLMERRPDGQVIDHNVNVPAVILEGKKYFNIEFQGYMPQNEAYNDYLNSAHIVIGMGSEGFGLPEFHSVALGKHGVMLNVLGYKEWATASNSVLVSPSSKIEAYDGIFFVKGRHLNQGNIFTFDEDAFIAGCEEAIKRVETDPINKTGLELQQQFQAKRLVDGLLAELKK